MTLLKTLPLIAALGLVAVPALASSSIPEEQRAEITRTLTEQGYEVRKIDPRTA
ncbi:hypothetical protein [Mesobacterium pallidum]|uniref:hypothetical protein n=1 Tax=Mesobacterium pallidum TaxID=2872037 RepID=UPI001EE22D8D|nr:hypothetical protein [Mesobacterium pallidum]